MSELSEAAAMLYSPSSPWQVDMQVLSIDVVDRIHKSGGRFLKRTAEGWSEVSVSVAHGKVAQSFRNRKWTKRQKLTKNTPTATDSSENPTLVMSDIAKRRPECQYASLNNDIASKRARLAPGIVPTRVNNVNSAGNQGSWFRFCLLYTYASPRD